MTATKRIWTQRIALTALLLTMTVMAGCLQGESIRTGNYYPPKPNNAIVNVYMDTAPNLPYEEVGIVSATGTEWNADLVDVLRTMKRQVRALGADAVIVTDTWYTEEFHIDNKGNEHIHEKLHATGIAIKYL